MTTSPHPTPDQPPHEGRTPEAKTPWIAPQIQVIAAGQAETSTRGARSDGVFTTS